MEDRFRTDHYRCKWSILKGQLWTFVVLQYNTKEWVDTNATNALYTHAKQMGDECWKTIMSTGTQYVNSQ